MAEFNDKIPLVAVVGPTASGKTGLGVALAKAWAGEVVSADSMQVYKGMDIATATPSLEERDNIPHHLMGFLGPEESYNAADYVRMAHSAIGDIHRRGRLPILVGGTGLYVSSLLENVDFGAFSVDQGRRRQLENEVAVDGGESLLELLKGYDPQLAARLHPHDHPRIIRGILVYEATGKPLSWHKAQSKRIPSPYDACIIGLNYINRDELYERINLRVEQMVDQGLVEEARNCRPRLSQTAAAAIGHKELYPYLDGVVPLREAVDKLKRETRRYAKRQLTWFRRMPGIHWIYLDEVEDAGRLAAQASAIVKDYFGGERDV